MNISRASVIRELDRRMIEEVGLPSPVLMEHAGHGVADALQARFGLRRTVLLCGPGNNGGDGYVVARHLAMRGAAVVAVPLLPPRSPDCLLHHGVADRLGLVGGIEALADAELVVDAVFGTGQRGPMALPALACAAPVVALDVPTGVDADSGRRLADFLRPSFTITIGRRKPFLYVDPVPWAFVDIGLERVATEAAEAVEVNGPPLPPKLPLSANKWSRGHLGVLAGSPEKAGAGVLACTGALRAGAGLVTLFVDRSAWGRLGALPPEVMVEEPGHYERLDALVVGPGLGRSQDEHVRELWRSFDRPMVVDADGLRALDGRPSPHPRLLTPHAGEAAALLGEDWLTLEADRLDTARRLGAIAPCIYKGACPVLSGAPLRVVWGAAPALGTGGSGDVLAGVAGALCARGLPVPEAALLATQAHAEAGRRLGVGATATEIAVGIARLLG